MSTVVGLITNSREGATTNVTLNTPGAIAILPAGLQVGDDIYVGVNANSGVGVVTAAACGTNDWVNGPGAATLLGASPYYSGANMAVVFMHKVADAADVAAAVAGGGPQFTWNVSSRPSTTGVVLRGEAGTNQTPVVVNTGTAGATITGPSKTTADNLADVYVLGSNWLNTGTAAGALSYGTGFTTDKNSGTAATSGANLNFSVGHLTTPVASGNTVGGQTITSAGGSGARIIVMLIEIDPHTGSTLNGAAVISASASVVAGPAQTFNTPAVLIQAAASLAATGTTPGPAAAIGVSAHVTAGPAQTFKAAAAIGVTASLTAGGAISLPGTVNFVIAQPSNAGFAASINMTGATSVRLAVSTHSNMASPSFVAAQTPDADGYCHWAATGLTPGTQYYYQAADTPTGAAETMIGAIGQVATLPAVGTPAASIKFALGSCTNGHGDGVAFADLVAWGPAFLAHVGDLHYKALTSTTESVHRAGYEDQLENAVGMTTMLQKVPLFYCRSDHEAGPDNGDSDNAYTTTAIEAYEQVFPLWDLPDVRVPTVGLYRSWIIGRVRFIMTDVRNTDRSPGLGTDNSSKTMLGATQKAWLKNELIDANDGIRTYLKVWLNDTQWMGANDSVVKGDWWPSYDTERQELISYIAAHNVNVAFLHGDMHAIAVASKATNTWGGFPVYCGSPFNNTGGGRDQGTFDQVFNNGGAAASQYMRLTLTDDGTTITLAASGWDAISNSQQVSQTDTWITAQGAVNIGVTAAVSAGSKQSFLAGAAIGVSASVTAGGTRQQPAAATISVAAAVTAGTGRQLNAAAAVTVSAALTAGAGQTVQAAATVTVSAAVVAGGTPTRPGAVTVSVTASLVAGGVLTQPAAAAVTVLASLTAGGATTVQTAVVISVSAGLVAGAGPQSPAGAAILVHASVAAAGLETLQVAASIAGVASVVVGGTRQSPIAVAIAVAAALLAGPSRTSQAAVTVTVTSSVVAGATIVPAGTAAVAITVTVAVHAGAGQSIPVAVLIAGTATLTAGAVRQVPAAAAITVSSALTAGANRSTFAGVAISVLARLAAAVVAQQQAAVAITVHASVMGTPAIPTPADLPDLLLVGSIDGPRWAGSMDSEPWISPLEST